MNNTVSSIIEQVTSNFKKATVTNDDSIHHYAWQLRSDEIKALLDNLSNELVVVCRTCCPSEQSAAEDEVRTIAINHQNYLVVTVANEMVLFGSEKSHQRAEQFAKQNFGMKKV